MPEPTRIANKKILIVEDNPDISESLELLLRHRHYDVAVLSDGSRVKDLVLKFKPNIILMDVMIPPPDGFFLCKQLKSDPVTRDIPIVLLSAKAQKSEIDKGIALGADRYLTKPYRNDDVLRMVSELLNR